MTEPRDDELSALRIRHVSQTRRALYRARSWCIIAAVGGGVGATQLAWMGWRISAMCAALGGIICLHRARAFHRQARNSAIPDPSTPPDFSTLSDGSQRWKHLDDVTD